MSKKIVILNGSARKKGNTAKLVEYFSKGAREAGNEVETFYLDGLDIHGCRGCFRGDSSREYPCLIQDDMKQIYPAIKEADIVVLASPLYYWNLSGQLINVLDRFYALEEKGDNLLRGNNKSCILLMAARRDDFDNMKDYFIHLLDHLRWENLGMILAGGNRYIGDIEGKPELDQAYELGFSIH